MKILAPNLEKQPSAPHFILIKTPAISAVRYRIHLLTHYRETIDLPQLAAELGLSYPHFRAAFKKQTGASPYQYQLEIRINQARELLSLSHLPIGEIGERIGFSGVHHFSRLFKQKTGVSPSEFRNRGT
jgi:AraC-like DNA-binding protein